MTARHHVLAALFESGRKGSDFYLPEPEPWTADAVCAQTDPEAWFPDKGGSTRAAKAICRSCPVIAECLAYALRNDERYGIYGGLSERERRRLKPCTEDIARRSLVVRSMRASGLTVREIAVELGLGESCVRDDLARALPAELLAQGDSDAATTILAALAECRVAS